MALPKRILMASDFSEASDLAAAEAIALAELVGARLDWTHVIDTSLESTPLFEDRPAVRSPLDQARRLVAMKLDTWRNRAMDRGIESDAIGLEGEPARAILAHAASLGVDLIVVGSHGHGALLTALLGSIAERIVRDATCSVLIVRSEGAFIDGASDIVVGEDLAATSTPARSLASALAERLGVPLRVVHALDVGIPYLATLDVLVPKELVADLYADARDQLESIAEQIPDVRVIHEEVSSERPAKAICEAARRVEASLVVVGSHGRHGVGRILLGSTAERVVRHAPCSVLVAR